MSENHDAVVKGTLHSSDGIGVVRLEGRFETSVDDLWSALTDPQRLARWYGNVDGDLFDGGEFTAKVFASGWDGRGSIDVCDPGRELQVTMWEEEQAKHVVMAELNADEDYAVLLIEVRGIALDVLFAYGAGWQVHTEDLGSYLTGSDYVDRPSRWNELEPIYRQMTIVPIEAT
jgi:uncharacterized protein YndB with AHSA1/START domain